MKYFICALNKINLGIPAEKTERIIQVTQTQDAAHSAVYKTENQEVFISLPALFQQKDSVLHGIVLKSNTGEPSAVKTVLLTPRIDVELEIPEESIYSLPKVLAGVFRNFRGAYCTGQNVILILNTEKLMEGML